jgi:isocitrate dehydrogenase kinase/phosphatase
MSEPSDVAAAGAAAIAASFEAYHDERALITSRARRRFEAKDWAGGQADARERLDLRDRIVNSCVGTVRAELGGAAHDHALWRSMKELYETRIEARPDREIAQSFFNSVTRRVFVTVGVDPAIEFLAADGPAVREGPVPVYARYRREVTTEALLRTILRAYAFSVRYEDLDRDARPSRW